MDRDERELYESFQALRREEEASVPRFAVPLPETRRRRATLPLALAIACLAAMIAAAFWLRPGERVQTHRGRDQAAVSITSWTPETDFLLRTPDRELIDSVPAIGEWPAAPLRVKKHLHAAKTDLKKEKLP